MIYLLIGIIIFLLGLGIYDCYTKLSKKLDHLVENSGKLVFLFAQAMAASNADAARMQQGQEQEHAVGGFSGKQ